MNTVKFFTPKMPDNISVRVRYQPVELLRNRANGRNEAAKNTEADYVWFTDADYMFINKVWEDLDYRVKQHPEAKFLAPLGIYETDWPTGDRLIAAQDQLAVRNISLTGIPFVRKKVAIGGLQIAHGPTVRKIGYCPEMQGPSAEWVFRSDVRFRHHPAMSEKEEISLNSVVRVRHTNKGYGQPDRHTVTN